MYFSLADAKNNEWYWVWGITMKCCWWWRWMCHEPVMPLWFLEQYWRQQQQQRQHQCNTKGKATTTASNQQQYWLCCNMLAGWLAGWLFGWLFGWQEEARQPQPNPRSVFEVIHAWQIAFAILNGTHGGWLLHSCVCWSFFSSLFSTTRCLAFMVANVGLSTTMMKMPELTHFFLNFFFILFSRIL